MRSTDKIAKSALDLIGGTPMVRLNKVVEAGMAEVLGKCENLNPAGSVKDRIALSMIEAAENGGRLKPGDTIVVPQKIEAKTPPLALWQSVASIVGSVALTAAGIAVIGR